MDLVGEVVACLTYVDTFQTRLRGSRVTRAAFGLPSVLSAHAKLRNPELRHIWLTTSPSTGASITNPIREPRMAASTEKTGKLINIAD